MEILPGTKTSARITFGLFEADFKAGELWKAGYRIKIQALPFKVLKILLENAGEVVTREELQKSVWGPDVIVDFEHALSNAIKKLREALGDSADNPRFIETLSRRGFRFIAPVSFGPQTLVEPAVLGPVVLTAVETASQLQEPEPEPAPIASPKLARTTKFFYGATFVLGAVCAGAILLFWPSRHHTPELPRISQLTQDGMIYSPKVLLLGTLSALATDGTHVFSPTSDNGQMVLSQVSLATGASQTFPVPREIGVPEIQDVSPDGTQLLLRSNLASASQQPLWIVPIDGGSAFRVADVLAQAATWMPDGRSILYTSGNQISIVSLDTGRSSVLATLPGRAFWPRWSPDGKLLRFTIIDTVNHTSSLWQLAKGESEARQILKGWNSSGPECCGTWTADSKHFVFEATRDGSTDLWTTDASGAEPVRITNGPLNFKAPLSARNGGQIFFVGQDIHSRLEQYDANTKHYVPVAGFLSIASHVVYSRDNRWVAWIDDKSRLWRAKNDGSEKVLLTPPSMHVFMANWSPDNTQLALMARNPKQPWQVFLVRNDGGAPERISQEDRNLGDPAFSADGKTLVFGTIPELMSKSDASSYLAFVDLATRRVTKVPRSDGLYSPKWSPDGHYIAALTLAQKTLTLYDTQTGAWQPLSSIPADHPTWAPNSKAILFRASTTDQKPIYRIGIEDKKIEQIADLRSFRDGNITHAEFVGITPEGVPLMHTEVSSGNLFSMDLRQR